MQAAGWAAPKGYADGVAVLRSGSGKQIYAAGRIGWNAEATSRAITWYLLGKREYVMRSREIGMAYREVLGREFEIAMSAVQVAGLIEDRAKVEIEVTAVVP